MRENIIRIIARLDIKGENLIKGINLEGLRVIGDPNEFAMRYYEQGADELLYMDAVASLYGRNSLTEVIRYTAQNIFIPLTVGGGIRSINDVDKILRAGADKVAINTAAIQNPQLIREVAKCFGSQCMVVSIEAKSVGELQWEAYTDNGRERTQRDVIQWAQQAAELGAGEIIVTSVDNEGTRKGFDVNLVRQLSQAVDIPIIASGGFGNPQHLKKVVTQGQANAVAIADALHYNRYTIADIKSSALEQGILVRT